MLDLEETLMVTNKIISGVWQKYSSVELPPMLKEYESESSGRIRHFLFTGDLEDLTPFANENNANNSIVKSLDYVLRVLKKEFSSMPETNKQMRRALKLVAKWFALATISYEDEETAKKEIIGLVTDFSVDYNSQPLLSLSLAFTNSDQ